MVKLRLARVLARVFKGLDILLKKLLPQLAVTIITLISAGSLVFIIGAAAGISPMVYIGLVTVLVGFAILALILPYISLF